MGYDVHKRMLLLGEPKDEGSAKRHATAPIEFA